jgi:hypothetical protein
MQRGDWTRISELRGHDTVLTFMKMKRIATVRINAIRGYVSNSTSVTIDMTNSNVSRVLVKEKESKK